MYYDCVTYAYYAFVKRYYVFDPITRFVCVSKCVCVCVCVCVCFCLSVITFVVRWLNLATWCQVRSSTRTRKCHSSQDDLFPDNMDHPDHITFWPITSKVKNGFTPNFICMQCSSGYIIAYTSRILRSIDKSKCYGPKSGTSLQGGQGWSHPTFFQKSYFKVAEIW